MEKCIIVSYSKSVFTNRIYKSPNVTIKGFYKELKKPAIREDKDGACFILASFSKPHRSAANVIKYYGCVLDFDNTKLSFRKIAKHFNNYSYFLHSTHNHNHKENGKKFGNRYRLILPYKTPVSASAHSAISTYLIESIGANLVDGSSKAQSRPFYFPSCRKNAVDDFVFHENNIKKYFDSEKLLKKLNFGDINAGTIEQSGVTYKSKSKVLNDDNNGDDEATQIWVNDQYKSNKDADYKNIPKEAIDNRNNYVYSFASSCFARNYDREKTLALCVKKNKDFYKPIGQSEIITTVDSIYDRHKKNNDLQDFKDIVKRIGQSKIIKLDFPIIIKMIVNSESVIKESEKQVLIQILSEKTDIAEKVIANTIKKEIKNLEVDDEQEHEELFRKNVHIFDNYVYIVALDKVLHLHKPLMMKTDAFAKKLSIITSGKKNIPADLTKFLIGNDLLKVAEIISYRPDVNQRFFIDERGLNCVNSYVKPDLTPRVGSVKPMIKHFENLIRNKTERKIFLQYIAYMIQKPGKKIKWVIILKGSKRIGKSFIAEVFLEPIFGLNNVASIEARTITSQFNNWKGQYQVAVCHELKLTGEHKSQQLSKAELTDAMKTFVTDKMIETERKGVDAAQTRNNTNLIAFTNHEDVVYITRDEQRFYMLRADLIRPLSRAYYNSLIKWAEKNEDKMLNYFLNLDISDFDPYGAPHSDYTNEIKKMSSDWPEWIITQGLEEPDSLIRKAFVLSWNQIVSYVIKISEENGMDVLLMQSLYNARSGNGYRLYKAIRENGFVKWQDEGKDAKDYVYFDRKKTTVFRTPKATASREIINASRAKMELENNNDFVLV